MTNHATYYSKTLFKGWPKQAGNKPGDDLLGIAHTFGRAGKQSMALAMALRPEGVSAPQVTLACGAPQNNHRIKLCGQGYFKVVEAPKTEQGHTVYRVELTAKGKAKVERVKAASAAALTASPAKPKRERKAKVTAEPVTEATVTEQATA